jgi:hypothetical protein
VLDLPAEPIAEMYRRRWLIEMFFRTFKQMLGCKHLLSDKHNGVEIQAYCAMIVCMLIHGLLGSRGSLLRGTGLTPARGRGQSRAPQRTATPSLTRLGFLTVRTFGDGVGSPEPDQTHLGPSGICRAEQDCPLTLAAAWRRRRHSLVRTSGRVCVPEARVIRSGDWPGSA